MSFNSPLSLPVPMLSINCMPDTAVVNPEAYPMSPPISLTVSQASVPDVPRSFGGSIGSSGPETRPMVCVRVVTYDGRH